MIKSRQSKGVALIDVGMNEQSGRHCRETQFGCIYGESGKSYTFFYRWQTDDSSPPEVKWKVKSKREGT